MWPLLRAQGNCRINNFVARSGPGKLSGSGLKPVETRPAAIGHAAQLQASPEGKRQRQGSGVVFTAFDRVWPLVGLALTLVAIVCWMTLLGHLAIKLL